jgi:hypothetical protein
MYKLRKNKDGGKSKSVVTETNLWRHNKAGVTDTNRVGEQET